ncbi:PREDICTED: early light-induced protein 2, chloroplastic-like [Ipomoea nil]|uniref:early light-induced protein 2, chloroplastic-like n=1 Tax=Ipomoea nil TaxID=35883 RepID=UPI0009014B71|nr:PREDICTED: early light-induced protein 2, chloroplastic-like [Ipomoea nil]
MDDDEWIYPPFLPHLSTLILVLTVLHELKACKLTCNATDYEERATNHANGESSTIVPKPTLPPSPTPKVVAKSSTNLWDILSFSGTERINGRLVMIGFAAAMGMELANGGDLFVQIPNGGVT